MKPSLKWVGLNKERGQAQMRVVQKKKKGPNWNRSGTQKEHGSVGLKLMGLNVNTERERAQMWVTHEL